MRFRDQTGIAHTVERRRRRMRGHELLAYRDLMMMRRHLDGMSQGQIADLFNLHQSQVSRRLAEMPDSIIGEMRRAVFAGEPESDTIETLVPVLRRFYERS